MSKKGSESLMKQGLWKVVIQCVTSILYWLNLTFAVFFVWDFHSKLKDLRTCENTIQPVMPPDSFVPHVIKLGGTIHTELQWIGTLALSNKVHWKPLHFWNFTYKKLLKDFLMTYLNYAIIFPDNQRFAWHTEHTTYEHIFCIVSYWYSFVLT